MKSGDLSTGAAKLQKAWKKLQLRWDQTRETWHDPVSQEFEEKYLLPLDPQITAILQRIGTLSASFAAAENECDRLE